MSRDPFPTPFDLFSFFVVSSPGDQSVCPFEVSIANRSRDMHWVQKFQK